MSYLRDFRNSRYSIKIYEEHKWDTKRNVWVNPKHRKLSHFEVNPIGSNKEVLAGHISNIHDIYMLSNSYTLANKVIKFIKEFERKHG